MIEDITRFEYQPIDFNSIAKETDEFFSEYFSGAVEFKNSLVYSAETQISCDGVAFFIKVFLDAVFQQQMLRIEAYNEDCDMILEIRYRSDITLAETKMRECRGIARLSGFTVDFQQGRALLRFHEKPLNVLHLYAGSKTPIKDAFLRYFS